MTASPTDDLASAERRIQELTKELTRARGELAEAQEQQTATAEILRVISNSPTEPQRVFSEIAASAACLCDAYDVVIRQVDGDSLLLVAHHGPILVGGTFPLTRGVFMARVVLDQRTIHVADLQAESDEYPEGSDNARRLGLRTVLGVPLIRAGEAIGVIAIRRTEVRPFTDRQIELLKTFADQAVIAIENTRLFEAEQARTREVEAKSAELVQSLEYQTATSEVLQVISSSVSDATPVFDKILGSCARLFQNCNAFLALVGEDEMMHLVQSRHGLELDTTTTQRQRLQDMFPRPVRDSIQGYAINKRQALHYPDVMYGADVPAGLRKTADIIGVGNYSMLNVPMLWEGKGVGALTLVRFPPAPFTEKEIRLLKTFADQAVIAIENTRLFEAEQASKQELTEALEQQTATADVLKVISRSALDVQKVLDTLVESAASLCDSYDTAILQTDGDVLRIVSHRGHIPSIGQQGFVPRTRGYAVWRAILDRQTVHLADVQSLTGDYPESSAVARRLGYHTMLAVPLVGAGEAVGAITLRRSDVRPFTDRQIELLQTFADQAVIAIENTRLFEQVQARTRDLTESLEQQTAASEVLSVISSSPTDVQPVLDAIVKTAVKLCNSHDAVILLKDVNDLHIVAHHGPMAVDFARIPIARDTVAGRSIVDRVPVHIHDLADETQSVEFPLGQHIAVRLNQRTVLGLPLLREGHAIGCLFLRRTKLLPFTEKQIALLQTFADQAVIAIENTRLFEEVQARTAELTESLNYQTATSEVLSVISSSKFDLQPVLDTLVQSAAQLCEADSALIRRCEGDVYLVAATYGLSQQHREHFQRYSAKPDRTSVFGRVSLEGRTVHVPDVLADPEYNPARSQLGIVRSVLGVPLVREGNVVGIFTLQRREPRPYGQKQIELLETFADQAVIAIENTRLFEAEQASKRELTEALEQQTATADVLKVISRSALDLQKVLDALVESAARLCNAYDAAIFQVFGDGHRLVAHHGQIPFAAPVGQHTPALARGFLGARAIIERRTIQVADMQAEAEEYPESQKNAHQLCWRTALAVPLVHAGEAIGVILIRRGEVRPFTERQIELANTFADQAVIAIENTRLFEEVQARTRDLTRSIEELRALGEVGQTVSSTLDLSQVLQTVVEQACTMAYTSSGAIYVFDKGRGEFQLEASHNMSADHIARVRAQPIRLDDPIVGECGTRREAVQVGDLRAVTPTPLLDIIMQAGVRAILAVPLLHRRELIGALAVRRNQPGSFDPETVRLLEAFAAQSAIAVNNARLFKEIDEKGRELEIASQHKNQFVANMSHELRTPLAAILGYAELIQEGFYEPQGPKTLDALTRIRSNGKHLLGLINTVLDIAKIESGQFTLNMSEYAIGNVVETVRAATESLAQNKKLTLTTTVDKALPIGLGDEQRLTQVLLNLVGNAIKFTDAGEVSIAAGTRNGHFAVSVTDTGPGIPLDQQDRIFEQFHQVDSSMTKAKGGTGLGLAIAKQIVEMHGGRIWVESTPGKGSTFQMELPTRTEFRKPSPGGMG
jgi:GAF domain-containing protein